MDVHLEPFNDRFSWILCSKDVLIPNLNLQFFSTAGGNGSRCSVCNMFPCIKSCGLFLESFIYSIKDTVRSLPENNVIVVVTEAFYSLGLADKSESGIFAAHVPNIAFRGSNVC